MRPFGDLISLLNKHVQPLSLVDFLESLLTALFLGAAIGFERQWRNSAAGLRTNTLVSVGAALFVLFAPLTGVKGDLRVAAQIVSGIGFIGGGAILREGLTIRGVNTAATLWCSAAIGCLCGAGLLKQSAIATAVILFANLVLRPISHRMMDNPRFVSDSEIHYHFQFTCGAKDESRLRKLLVSSVAETEFGIRSIRSEPIEHSEVISVKSELISARKNHHLMERIVGIFSSDSDADNITWEAVADKTPRE